MWKISTSRQEMARALRNTEMVPLRIPIPKQGSKLSSTLEWNQVLEIEDTNILKNTETFIELINWLKQSIINKGVNKIEFGRIFFSKHKPNSNIDIHTDEGLYFDYFDRFHFVIDQTDNENIFYIRDEAIKLLTGKLYWVNNHVPHYLENKSDKDRINLIFDARLY
jgi:hypothetical protein